MHAVAPGLREIVGKYSEAEQEFVRLEAGIEAMARAPYQVFVDFGILCSAWVMPACFV